MKLFEEFKRFEGQPVVIFTDDERKHRGIVLKAFENSVRIIERCEKILLIEYCHIDAVEEPQMELRHCRRRRDEDDFDDFDERNDDCDCGCDCGCDCE